jgi:uracil permease
MTKIPIYVILSNSIIHNNLTEVERLQRKIIQVQDKVPLSQWIPLSLQHMFAMFGASILVPIIFGIDPGIVLIMNGFGTLLFIFLTKAKAPAYLGSSFSFLGPAGAVISKAVAQGFTHDQAFAIAQGGFVMTGLVGMIFVLIIWKFGTKWINVILPPAAMGPVVALIGLALAGGAVGNDFAKLLITAKNAQIDTGNVVVFLVTLLFAVFGSVCFKKFFAVIPILIAIIAGYIASFFFQIHDIYNGNVIVNMVDLVKIDKAAWFALPHVQLPIFQLGAIFTIVPALLVLMTEHIGHQLVTSEVVGKNLLKDPGLHMTMLGDYLSTSISGMVGAVPTTTYGENIGVMAVTRVYSVRVIGGAAVISMVIAFIGKFTAFINTIPGAVIGGVSFLLYGMIAAAGIRVMVDAKVDFSKSRNLVLTAVTFIAGLSGVTINLGDTALNGMVLATLVGMLLSLAFFVLDKLHLTNDAEEVNEKAAAK